MLQFILILLILINYNNAFTMSLTKIKSKKDFIKITSNKLDNLIILYTGEPCKSCEYIRNQFNLVSEIDSIKTNWKFYEIDIRLILDISKNKKIYRIPVYEVYSKNIENNIELCYPYIETDFIEKLKNIRKNNLHYC